jgi:DNA processing protein
MDLQRAVALSAMPGISRPRAAAVFKALTDQSRAESIPLEDVVAACRPDADVSRLIAEALDTAASLLEAGRERGILPIPIWAAAYPPLLRTIVDPPPVLWVRGRAEALGSRAVAVIGSRAATPYAREVAMRLARELAERSVTVVSGLARGADAAAHRGCLDGGWTTIAVLGSGPDVIYPAEHRDLALNIEKHGALVSELGPGAPPLPEHFPLRNRLISGISLGVVVVEASDKSGSLITARCAIDQGRDVMAVPGSILSGRNRGSHSLLKDGAKVVETADDILDGLGWPVLTPAALKISGNSLIRDELLDRLTPGEAYGVDEMSATVGLTASQMLPRLTEWEVRGWIERIPGGRYALAGRE